MDFDPTHDYRGANLSDDEERYTFWNFGELIKTLITLSYEAEKQCEMIGYGAVCEEMVMDYDTYFTYCKEYYINRGLLTVEQVDELLDLDMYFENCSEEKGSDFWDDHLLSTSLEWQIVRQKSKKILEILGFEDLDISIERTEKYDTADDGTKLIIQFMNTRLIKR